MIDGEPATTPEALHALVVAAIEGELHLIKTAESVGGPHESTIVFDLRRKLFAAAWAAISVVQKHSAPVASQEPPRSKCP